MEPHGRMPYSDISDGRFSVDNRGGVERAAVLRLEHGLLTLLLSVDCHGDSVGRTPALDDNHPLVYRGNSAHVGWREVVAAVRYCASLRSRFTTEMRIELCTTTEQMLAILISCGETVEVLILQLAGPRAVSAKIRCCSRTRSHCRDDICCHGAARIRWIADNRTVGSSTLSVLPPHSTESQNENRTDEARGSRDSSDDGNECSVPGSVLCAAIMACGCRYESDRRGIRWCRGRGIRW
jgi:hypothetical protein